MCAGKLIADIIRVDGRALRYTALGTLSIGLAFSFYYSLAGLAEIRNDDRNLARQWLIDNVANSQTIEMTPLAAYRINVPEGYGSVSEIPYYHYKETFVRMEESAVYKALYAVYSKMRPAEDAAPSGTELNDPQLVRTEPPETGIDALLRRKPEVLVLSGLTYDRFLSEQSNAKDYFPLQNNMYMSILEGRTPYKLVADFEKADDVLTPTIEFIDARIKIYQLDD